MPLKFIESINKSVMIGLEVEDMERTEVSNVGTFKCLP